MIADKWHSSIVFRMMGTIAIVMTILFLFGHLITIHLAKRNLEEQGAEQLTLQSDYLQAQIQQAQDLITEKLRLRFQLLRQFSALPLQSRKVEPDSKNLIDIHRNSLELVINSLLQDEDTVAIWIQDWNNNYYEGFIKRGEGSIQTLDAAPDKHPNWHLMESAIFEQGELLGTVTLAFTFQRLEAMRQASDLQLFKASQVIELHNESQGTLLVMNRTLEASLFFGILMLMIYWIAQSTILQPLHRLRLSADQLAQGKLNTEIDSQRTDELGLVAQSFAKMRDAIHEQIDTLKMLNLTIAEQNEELRKANSLKDEFLASTSHELRTPLHGIIGIAESLIDGVTGDLSSPTRSNLSMIVNSGKRLSHLINDILDLSKLRNRDIKLNRKPVALKPLADIILLMCQSLVRSKPVLLHNRISTDIPPVNADENRLQQILFNLVDNAIKYTKSGNVTVSAMVKGDQVEITVADTGVGIPNELQEHIFEAFEQGGESISRESGGTGLGLNITRKLIELHGSSIKLESEVGVGSMFTFSLPSLIHSKDTSPRSQELIEDKAGFLNSDSPPLSSDSHRNIDGVELIRMMYPIPEDVATNPMKAQIRQDSTYTILIVDDEPVNLQVLTNYLSFHDYHIEQANDGKQALELVEKHNPHLILLDVMMPQISGYEVCRRLRQKYPRTELPILLLTARSQPADVVAGFEAGANDYLTKPFAKEELLARIHTHLHSSQLNIAYGRFVPHQFLELLESSIIDVRLGDCVQQKMTILFSDLRSFTSFSEEMSPQENFQFLNAFLRRIGPSIREHNGFIDKFIGDSIMALFPRSADDAVQAGIAMMQKLEDYNRERIRYQRRPLRIGIGINTGSLMLGTIGEHNRMESTVISDAVNLASRIESLTKHYGVSFLLSEHTFHELRKPHQYGMRVIDRVQVRGKSQPVTLWDVFEGDPNEVREQKAEASRYFEEAVSLFHLGQFAEAEGLFHKYLAHCPDDRASQQFLERCQEGNRSPSNR